MQAPLLGDAKDLQFFSRYDESLSPLPEDGLLGPELMDQSVCSFFFCQQPLSLPQPTFPLPM